MIIPKPSTVTALLDMDGFEPTLTKTQFVGSRLSLVSVVFEVADVDWVVTADSVVDVAFIVVVVEFDPSLPMAKAV